MVLPLWTDRCLWGSSVHLQTASSPRAKLLLRDLVTAHDIRIVELAIRFRRVIPSRERTAFRPDHPQSNLVVADGRIQIDRNAHQAEGDGSGPERPCAGLFFGGFNMMFSA